MIIITIITTANITLPEGEEHPTQLHEAVVEEEVTVEQQEEDVVEEEEAISMPPDRHYTRPKTHGRAQKLWPRAVTKKLS